jgi:hypothetical protein
MADLEATVRMQLQGILDGGYTLNPEPFAKLLGWNDILAQLHMAAHYIESLKAFQMELGEAENVFRQNAYFVAFLTTYGKCFASTGGRSVKLEAKDVFEASTGFRAAHDRIMQLRNTYAAHKDASGLIINNIAVRQTDNCYLIRHLTTSAVPMNEFGSFASAVAVAIEYVVAALNKRWDKLQARLGKPIVLD